MSGLLLHIIHTGHAYSLSMGILVTTHLTTMGHRVRTAARIPPRNWPFLFPTQSACLACTIHTGFLSFAFPSLPVLPRRSLNRMYCNPSPLYFVFLVISGTEMAVRHAVLSIKCADVRRPFLSHQLAGTWEVLYRGSSYGRGPSTLQTGCTRIPSSGTLRCG